MILDALPASLKNADHCGKNAANPLVALLSTSPYNRPMTSDAFTPAARMRLAKRELLILCARIGYNP
ncbi:MAG: hypothetical protein Q8K13_08370 [Parvibaculum sp.]|uniref:hypothetical protein n=1 Tax=Parvibaculum sp. TaxID=2024848 RepID=UPI002730BCD0|nr:hypothetical protein [Parvibaculum sp.]MDP2149637.1 hypothetical protein [Parvibaculum sp.]